MKMQTMTPAATYKINTQYCLIDASKVRSVLACYGIHFPYILYVGSDAARKNLARLLEAYAQLCDWSSQWRLVIGGVRSWKSGPFFTAVQQLNLAERLHFIEFVEEEDLPALYNGADLFVFPSLYEGFGLPVLEAMACGTPVVTSNTASLPEVAGDAAVLVDPYNVDEMAAAICRVLADKALAATLRYKGLARVRKFSWERTAQQTAAVYEKVLAPAKGEVTE